VQLLVVAVI